MINPDLEKLFLEHFYALHNDKVLLSIFEKFGIRVFRRSCVLRNFERFITQHSFKGKRCVEIGTHHGLTAIVLARFFDEVISIDNTPNELKHKILEFTGLQNVKFIDIKNNKEKRGLIEGLSFDAAFSDANHHDDTQFDFDLVSRSGRVLFDEYYKDQPPVWELVNKLTKCGDVVHDWKFALWTAHPMDHFIRTFPKERDNDLYLCRKNGVAYQVDMTHRIEYAEDYFKNYVKREGTHIANKLNNGRRALVDKYLLDQAVVDIGVGSGEFIKARPNTFGYDINHHALKWLTRQNLYTDNFDSFMGFTFWDVIEHVSDPNIYFKWIPVGAYLFTSLPIMPSLDKVRRSKHFKPGEHLFYWTEGGFVDWMKLYGFELIEKNSFETEAGREQIGSFVFRRIGNG